MTVSIFVEGIADKKFIEDLFKSINPLNSIEEIIVTKGYTNLKNFEPKISFTNDLEGKNYIIFDADQNKSDKIFEINRIENLLKCSIKYFFLPNNEDPGDLEDLLKQIINPTHQIIIDCFDHYQTCLNSNDYDYTLPNKKALIFAYCEAILEKNSKQIKEKNRDYFNKKLWDIESEALNPLKEFLKKILKLNEL